MAGLLGKDQIKICFRKIEFPQNAEDSENESCKCEPLAFHLEQKPRQRFYHRTAAESYYDRK